LFSATSTCFHFTTKAPGESRIAAGEAKSIAAKPFDRQDLTPTPDPDTSIATVTPATYIVLSHRRRGVRHFALGGLP
jgi:hypothetical protein